MWNYYIYNILYYKNVIIKYNKFYMRFLRMAIVVIWTSANVLSLRLNFTDQQNDQHVWH